MNFFVDTFFTKVNVFFFQIVRAEGNEKEEQAIKLREVIKKEIEPLLSDAQPFFGGSKTMTLADVRSSPCFRNLFLTEYLGACCFIRYPV